MPVAVALTGISAVALGSADFAGGMATRRSRAVAVGAATQTLESLALGLIILVVHPAPPSATDLGLGLIAGLVGSLGLVALYEGLALGGMGVVAGLSGVGSVAIPVVVSALLGASVPTMVQLAGIGLAVAASLLAVAAHPSRASRNAVAFGLLAAVGLGTYLLFLNAGVGSVLWTLAASRVAAAVFLTILSARGASWSAARGTLGLIAIAGTLDLMGNILIVLALGSLPVGLVAAIGGTYPVATGVLAWVVLRERLRSPAYVSIALAVAGMVLIGQR